MVPLLLDAAHRSTSLYVRVFQLRAHYEEVTAENIRLAGHQNLKQKIQMHMKIKQENDQLKRDKQEVRPRCFAVAAIALICTCIEPVDFVLQLSKQLHQLRMELNMLAVPGSGKHTLSVSTSAIHASVSDEQENCSAIAAVQNQQLTPVDESVDAKATTAAADTSKAELASVMNVLCEIAQEFKYMLILCLKLMILCLIVVSAPCTESTFLQLPQLERLYAQTMESQLLRQN